MTVQGAVEAIEQRARRAGASVSAASLHDFMDGQPALIEQVAEAGGEAMVIRETTTVPFWSGMTWTLVTVVASAPSLTAPQMQSFTGGVARLVAAGGGSDGRGLATVAAAALMVGCHVGPDLGPGSVEPVQHNRVLVWPVVVDLERAAIVRAPRRMRGGAGGAWVSRRINALSRTAIRAGLDA